MKTLLLVITCFLLFSCSSKDKMSSTDAESFKLRPYQEVTLSNGLRVLLLEDKQLPYITYGMLLKTGVSSDPSNRLGLSSFVAEMLDKGTRKRSASAIADSLGQLGSGFSASVNKDYAYFTVKGLAFHRQELLNDFADIMTRPAFQNKEIVRLRKQVLARLRKLVDNPGGFAGQMFEEYLFNSHPYGHNSLGTSTSVKRFKRKDIIRYYLKYYRPNNAILAVVGKFDSAQVRDELEKALAHWKPRSAAGTVLPGLGQISGKQIRVIDKPDLVQSQLRLGHKGISRDNPDFLTLRVANQILGGSFTGRLYDRVRDDLGLTYGIYSYFEALKGQGSFRISTFTRNEKLGETLNETISVLKKFRDDGVSDREVEMTKEYLKGTFPRAIETAERLAYNMQILRLYGIKDDYLTDYLKNIDAIETADVNRVIKKYFDPDNLKILVYTNAKQTLGQIQSIGEIEVKDYKNFIVQ